MHGFRRYLAALAGRGASRAETIAARVRFALGLALGGLAAYLALAPKPWHSGVAAARARGGNLDVLEFAVSGLWWAALANAALLVVAWFTLRHWLTTGPAPVSAALAPPARRPSGAFMAGLLGAMLLGGWFAEPRLDHSLWTDEVITVMRVVDGYWRPTEDDDSLEFRDVGWLETLWYYRMPNNHGPHSILARLSLNAWQHGHPDAPRRFDERALRRPAYVAGVAAIASAGALLWRAGYPAAGLVLAWLLALHPWHLRYAGEARGFSLVLLLVPMHLTLLLAVLHRGSWPRWLAYGATQVALLWTYPGIVFELLLANGVAGAGVVALHREPADRRSQLTRWLVANVAGAMLWLQLTAPHVPQLFEWMDGDLRYGQIAGRWLTQLGAHLYLGVPWKLRGASSAFNAQLVDSADGTVAPALVAGALLVGVGVVLGAARLLRGGPMGRVLGPLLLLPGPLTWLAAWLFGVHLRTWYLIFMLPSWGALLALGVTWPLVLRGRPTRGAALLGIVALLLAYAVASSPFREVLRTRSMQPRRESVAHTRPDMSLQAPGQARILTASFLKEPMFYDPRVVSVREVQDLRALMSRADREGLALYVNVGGLPAERRASPALKALVVEGDLFEEDAVFHGFLPAFTRHVFRYRGQPADRSDLGTD